MQVDNSHHLAAAQVRRHHELVERTSQTLRRLDRDGTAVTFTAVARAAGVSRAFLYNTPLVRDEIDRLRQTRPAGAARPPVVQRRSENSKDALIARLTDDNRQLRADNRELHTHNETLLGRLREGSARA
jgi:hypothetical protein